MHRRLRSFLKGFFRMSRDSKVIEEEGCVHTFLNSRRKPEGIGSFIWNCPYTWDAGRKASINYAVRRADVDSLVV